MYLYLDNNTTFFNAKKAGLCTLRQTSWLKGENNNIIGKPITNQANDLNTQIAR